MKPDSGSIAAKSAQKTRRLIARRNANAASSYALNAPAGIDTQWSWWESGWFKEWERIARPEK
jgi:hypothetical protein